MERNEEPKTRFQRWKENSNKRIREQHLTKQEQLQLKNLKAWSSDDDKNEKYKAWLRFNRSKKTR
tara:strand:- start:1731 stop:1925 length:195 start_codon:yes stop_codon:yes gene_type:complete